MKPVGVSTTRSLFRDRFPLSKRTAGRPAFRRAGEDRLNRREAEIAELFDQSIKALPPDLALAVMRGQDTSSTLTVLVDTFSSVAPQIAQLLWEQIGDSGREAINEIAPKLAADYRRVGKAARPSELVMSFSFDEASPTAVAWARNESARLVTNMAAEQQQVIRALIADGIELGRTRPQQSKALLDILRTTRPSTRVDVAVVESFGTNMNGLTLRYEQAVVNRAMRTADDLASRGITGVKAAEKVRKESEKYAEKLRKARARTIARTEIQRAHNEGRLQAYQQLMNAGLVSPQAQKQWVVSPFDVCPICVPLGGVTVPTKGTFPNGQQSPPAHPNCRCDTILVTNPELYQPPQALGTGAPDDPFRVRFPGTTPKFDDLATRPLPGTTPSPASTTPTTTAPTPTPQPSAGRLVDVDDLRADVEVLRTNTVGEMFAGDILNQPSSYLERELTAEAKRALAAIDEAGRRVDEVVQKNIAQRIAIIDDEIEATKSVAREAAAKVEALDQQIRKAEADELLDYIAQVKQTLDPSTVISPTRNVRLFDDLDDLVAQVKSGTKELKYGTYQRVSPQSIANEIASHVRVVEGRLKTNFRLRVDTSRSNPLKLQRKPEWQFWSNVRMDALKLVEQKSQIYGEEFRRVINTIRGDIGTGTTKVSKVTAGGRLKVSELRAALKEADSRTPGTWVEAVNARHAKNGGIHLKGVARGYHSDSTSTIALSKGKNVNRTATHELTHAFEYSVPGVDNAEVAFFNQQWQAAGRPRLQQLSKLSPGSGYKASEMAYDMRSIGFDDVYSTKWYSGGGPGYELFTRGSDAVQFGDFAIHDAYRRWFLGVYALL